MGEQIVHPEPIALLGEVDAVGGQVGIGFPVPVQEGLVHPKEADLLLGGHGGQGLVEGGDALVGDVVGLLVGLAQLAVHRDDGLDIQDGLGLAGPDGVDHLAVDDGEILRVVIAQLVDPQGYVDLAVLGLFQRLEDGDLLLPLPDDRLVLHHVKDGKAGVVQKGGFLGDAAEQLEAVGAGVANKDGVGKPVLSLHRRPLGDGDGVVRRGCGGGRGPFGGLGRLALGQAPQSHQDQTGPQRRHEPDRGLGGGMVPPGPVAVLGQIFRGNIGHERVTPLST